VVLSWHAPADAGSSAITGYRVTAYVGDTAQKPIIFNSSATTQTLGGLSQGATYTFTVAAINSVGLGQDSAPSPSVLLGGSPGAPTGVSASAGEGQATLNWRAPTETGGNPVTGYRVTPYIAGAAQPPATFNSLETTETVTGLHDGATYTFTVAAINASGVGAESEPSEAITPI
jgi:predicted phage tail protein